MVRPGDFYHYLVDKLLDVERATDLVAAYIHDQFYLELDDDDTAERSPVR